MIIVLFIGQTTEDQEEDRIKSTQKVEVQGWKIAVDGDDTEILDDAVHRVQQEKPLDRGTESVHLIEDGGQVIQKRKEDVVQVLCVPKEHIYGGQNHSHADIHDTQAQDGINE